MRAHLERIYLGARSFCLLLCAHRNRTDRPVLQMRRKPGAKWGGFTLKWYSELFQNQAILQALYNTLLMAFPVSAAIATIIGTMAAMGINGMNRKMKTILR